MKTFAALTLLALALSFPAAASAQANPAQQYNTSMWIAASGEEQQPKPQYRKPQASATVSWIALGFVLVMGVGGALFVLPRSLKRMRATTTSTVELG